jgi:putative oxidoreductase
VYGLSGVAAAFGEMGIPMAGVVGPTVAFVEFVGGLALAVGLLTRLSAAGLAAVMVGAALMVHRSAFFLPSGAEFTLLLAALAGAFILMGPGRYSLDARLARS